MTSTAPTTPKMKAAFQRSPRRRTVFSSSPGLTKRFIAHTLVVFAALVWGTAAADDLVSFAFDDLTVETAEGQQYPFTVELALTPRQRAQGLMYRQTMGPNEGMLFLFDREALRSFWMKNTLIPLDLIFINDQGVIVSIAPDAIPHDESPIPSGVPASAVLEVPAGTVDELAIAPGDRILHRAFADE